MENKSYREELFDILKQLSSTLLNSAVELFLIRTKIEKEHLEALARR